MADVANNVGTTAPEKRLGGITGKGFMPGRSGNPDGRPKGLMVTARRLTHDGDDLSRFMWRVFRGLDIGETPKGQKIYPTTQQRMEAATWLADRGWGKPAQTVQLATKRLTVFELPDGSVVPAKTPQALAP